MILTNYLRYVTGESPPTRAHSTGALCTDTAVSQDTRDWVVVWYIVMGIHGIHRGVSSAQVGYTSIYQNGYRENIFPGAGCDESLVSKIVNGQAKRKSHGGVYYFKCKEGSVMKGSHVVVCDGKNWNDTTPTCLSRCKYINIVL